MIVTLKDGSKKEYSEAMSVIDIAKDISEGLARNACAGEIDGKVVDLRTVVSEDCSLNILTFNDEAGKKAYWHTTSHVLAEAVKRLYPDAKLTIGPSIDEGFYYDFDCPAFDRAALDNLEAEMARAGYDRKDIARVLNVHLSSAYRLLDGTRTLSISRAKTIRDALFPEQRIDYLFNTQPQSVIVK